MIVSMWMTRDVVTIRSDAPVAEAAALMARSHIRRLIVVDRKRETERIVGIISATDILHAFPADVNPFAVEAPDLRQAPLTVREMMKGGIQATAPDTPIEEAAAVMRENKIGALPVLRKGQLAGIITESDIFRAFVSLFSIEGRGARITFDVSQGEDMFGLMAKLAPRHGVRVVSMLAAQQESQPVCVVRVVGDKVDSLLDELWSSGHPVLNVLRFPIAPQKQ